ERSLWNGDRDSGSPGAHSRENKIACRRRRGPRPGIQREDSPCGTAARGIKSIPGIDDVTDSTDLHPTVILSGIAISLCEMAMQSKDLHLQYNSVFGKARVYSCRSFN